MAIADYLIQNAQELGLSKDNVYSEFPIYKDLDQKTVVIQTAFVSQKHGVVVFLTSTDRTNGALSGNKGEYISRLDEIYRLLFSKLIKNPILNKGRNKLTVPISTVVFAPSIHEDQFVENEVYFVFNEKQVQVVLDGIAETNTIDQLVYEETLATIEGAKGMIMPRKRDAERTDTKGFAANELEREICQFDEQQKSVNYSDITGISRIRGLAGSGKTVILCMKAAILHLKYPDATIVFTFYTKSLYQHVRRLITRFYRQFNDQDPNWEKMIVMHAWGTDNQDGVYRVSCTRHGITPISFEKALGKGMQPFDYVCTSFLQSCTNIIPLFDYMLIDEGQDFPTSFLKMCISLVKESKFVYAYDDLQTIFQRKAPDAKDLFGVDSSGRAKYSFSKDQILYKCYRNPLPIIVTAHAIGFGIYADSVAQMIDKEYWQDIGYEIKRGDFKEGDEMEIVRPENHSQTTLTKKYSVDDLINVEVFDNFMAEIEYVSNRIFNDIITEKLHPEDILVISVDDRNASNYLNTIESFLKENFHINSNNIHADKFSINDFQQEGLVTLSTVHKAKGNEAYSVYIVGIDALYPLQQNVRERNLLFTAMTRSKGWLTMTGMGNFANYWKKELETAKLNCPSLKFKYPTQKQLKMMPRDLDDASAISNNRERLAQDLLKTMSVEQVIDYFQQKLNKKQ